MAKDRHKQKTEFNEERVLVRGTRWTRERNDWNIDTPSLTTRVQNVCACARSIFKMAVANANFTRRTPFL